MTGGHRRLRLVDASAAHLRDEVAALLERGGRVDGLYATGSGAGRAVRVVGTVPGERVIVRCPAPTGALPSLLDLAPALDWDQREARDLHGVAFGGDADHRPLVHHAADPADWATPVTGPDVHDVAVGPVHAGVIESGHFRFHVVGERILHLDARLFYKHRGLERHAEGLSPSGALVVVGRACAACAVANGLAFAQAVEEASGRVAGPGLRRVRTLLLEVERIYNHLNDIGQICAGVGLAAGAMAFAALKERAQRVARALTGHRFLFGAIGIAGSPVTVAASEAAAARGELAAVGREAEDAWRSLRADPSLQDRVRGAGVLPGEEARALGAVGPAARASGLRQDERDHGEGLWYPEFRPAAPEGGAGDVAARMEARALELRDSLEIADALLADRRPPSPAGDGPGATGWGLGRVEGARGLTWCAVELDGGCVGRVHLRTGSYANWPAVARAAAGQILPDFPLVNKSFELCYACADR